MTEGTKTEGTKAMDADPFVRNPDSGACRSVMTKCATCVWYAPTGSTQSIGRCRRHAPTMNGYPVVFFSDWCGDQKMDVEKL